MITTITPGTYQGKTADQWRAEAKASNDRRNESWERCDTDGFLSQWAHQMDEHETQLKAQLAENGGKTEVTALFDLDGNLISTLHGWGEYGEYFMILDADGRKDATRGRNGFFSPSQARNEATAVRNNAAKGFYVGTVRVPAITKIMGGGKGLAGAANCYAAIAPASQVITAADTEILDNGHETAAEPAPAEQPHTTEQETQMPETDITAPQTSDAPAELTVDIPGAFTGWFEDSSVMTDTDDKLDDASRALRQAYGNATPIRRGRSLTVRLTTTDREALQVLGEYADTVVQGGTDADFTLGEVRAARAVVERVQSALLPVRPETSAA